MADKPWTCPFCNRIAIIREADEEQVTKQFCHPLSISSQYRFAAELKYCPNPECKRFTLIAGLLELQRSGGSYAVKKLVQKWQLIPSSAAKTFPEYIPGPILADYDEACLIANLSPKASATLARRCLQGMIRDFWGISKKRLKDEIDALEDKVEPDTWDAIDAVRSIGNIGAHMEADINLIVDVDSDEASLLIGLIETLLADWYIARQNRSERMSKIKALATEKQTQREGNRPSTPESPPGA